MILQGRRCPRRVGVVWWICQDRAWAAAQTWGRIASGGATQAGAGWVKGNALPYLDTTETACKGAEMLSVAR